MKIKESIATLHGLSNDHSGTEDTHRLRKLGWVSVPVVDFGGTLYAIIGADTPHPGHNTAEVINVSEYNKTLSQIAVTTAQRKNHTEGWAWIMIGEGLSVLATHDDSLVEYSNPLTAVLSYRIAPPSKGDVRKVADMLDEELQEYGISWPRGG